VDVEYTLILSEIALSVDPAGLSSLVVRMNSEGPDGIQKDESYYYYTPLFLRRPPLATTIRRIKEETLKHRSPTSGRSTLQQQ
jgi:hypothetical protein